MKSIEKGDPQGRVWPTNPRLAPPEARPTSGLARKAAMSAAHRSQRPGFLKAWRAHQRRIWVADKASATNQDPAGWVSGQAPAHFDNSLGVGQATRTMVATSTVWLQGTNTVNVKAVDGDSG